MRWPGGLSRVLDRGGVVSLGFRQGRCGKVRLTNILSQKACGIGGIRPGHERNAFANHRHYTAMMQLRMSVASSSASRTGRTCGLINGLGSFCRSRAMACSRPFSSMSL